MNPDPIQNKSAEAIPAPTAPTTAGMTTKVVKGSLWTLAGQVAPLGVSLFTTPFVIRLLGSEGYGVLILVGLIPTYFAFADLGMGIASTKFASEAYAAGDAKREASTVHTAAAMSFILSVPVAALIFIFSNFAVGLFNVPEHLRGEANLALKIASVTFVLNFLNSIFNTPQLTRLRMDLNTFVSSGFRMLGLIATPITIYLGGGIVGAVAVLLCVSLLTLAANIAVSGKLLRELFTFTLNRNAIRPMLKFGYPVGLTLIAAAFLINSEKAVLASVADVKTLAHYSVAFNFAGMATMFSVSMLQSLTPAFSQLLSPAKRSQLEILYARAIRLNIIVVLPTLTLMIVVARPLLTIWAGPEFGRESTVPFYILVCGLFFNLLAYVSQALLLSAGRSGLIAKLNWLELIPYIVLTGVFAFRYGAAGAAFAWSVRVMVDCFIIIWLASRYEGAALPAKSLVKRAVISIVILSPAPLYAVFISNSPLILSILTIFSLALYATFVWMFALDKNEREMIAKRLFVLLSFLRKSVTFTAQP